LVNFSQLQRCKRHHSVSFANFIEDFSQSGRSSKPFAKLNGRLEMKLTLITILLTMVAFSANARRGHRTSGQCTYNLERIDGRRGYIGEIVDTVTKYGWDSCREAELVCEEERFLRRRPWNFECKEVRAHRPRPDFGTRCEYKIETRLGFEPESYVSVGFGSCGLALAQCERDLKYKRSLGYRNGGVGPHAKCVQVSDSRPRPRPLPRLETASCTAAMFAGRMGRRTPNEYTRSASALSYSIAREDACSEAMRECNRNVRGTMYCQVVN